MQGKLSKGMVYLGVLSIYYRLGRTSFVYKSLVMPLFEYADLVWDDKDNFNLIAYKFGKIRQLKSFKIDRSIDLRRMH